MNFKKRTKEIMQADLTPYLDYVCDICGETKKVKQVKITAYLYDFGWTMTLLICNDCIRKRPLYVSLQDYSVHFEDGTIVKLSSHHEKNRRNCSDMH